eukprot:Skav226433  [mRNA]  locus=scaffold696:187629:188329:+ [translate_table: standard]
MECDFSWERLTYPGVLGNPPLPGTKDLGEEKKAPVNGSGLLTKARPAAAMSPQAMALAVAGNDGIVVNDSG